jgi:hypothetical protein
MCAFWIPHRLHERGNIVCEKFGGIGALGFIGFHGSPKVEREAGEKLRVRRHLERVAGVIRCQIRIRMRGSPDPWWS